MPKRALLALALAAVIATPALAADDTHANLTIYRSSSDALFSAASGATVDAGHAVVHEQRNEYLEAGTHDMVIGNLPDYLDPEAVHLSFNSSHVSVLSQRLLLPQGDDGSLSGHIGKSITVLGSNGDTLAKGMLTRITRDGSLVIGGDVFGPSIVRKWAAVKLTGGQVGGGARLQLRVKADSAGKQRAMLTYPTSGLGWRAVYTGVLEPDHACRMRVDAQASIANRSGRDWADADIKLVAGEPNLGQSGYRQPVMMRAMAANAAPTPKQDTLGSYHSYTLPGAVTLPANSVTLAPLYNARTLDCQRVLLTESGNTYLPAHPVLDEGQRGAQQARVSDIIRFEAHDSYPAGIMRVLTRDDDGQVELLGRSNLADTPKGQPVRLLLGTAFDLSVQRERASFKLDKIARTLDTSWHITVNNAGKQARTVTVREHPWRWRVWQRVSSSSKPDKQTPDTLEFQLKVPAGGSATLDYAIRYSWTAADE